MNSAMSDELRMLRARAYGPAPDIADDPAAMRRLAELEDLARVKAPRHEPAAERGEPIAPAVPEGAETADDPAGVPAVTADAAPPADARALSRRVRILWIASVAATAAVAVVLTLLAVSAGSPPPGEARQVGTVEQDSSLAWPSFFGARADDSIAYADFYGLTALRQGGGAIGRDGMDCVAVFLTESVRSAGDSYIGPSFFGCGTAAIPARVPVLVDASMPEELLDRFPLGSALEFVVDGELLTVFAAETP